MRKYTIDDVRKFVDENSKCTVISTEYANNRSKLIFRCKCGNDFSTTFTNFKGSPSRSHKRTCDECSRAKANDAKKLSIEHVRKHIEDNSNCVLISDRYVGANSKLELICGCGAHFKTTWSNIQAFNKLQCNDCGIEIMKLKQRKTHDAFVKEVYVSAGGRYTVLGKYLNNTTKVLIHHNECGEKFEMEPSNFLQGQRCPKCFGTIKLKHHEFEDRVMEMYGEEYSVVGKYVNAKTKVSILHAECGGVWDITPNNFSKGQRCPYCCSVRNSKGSQDVKSFLDNSNIEYESEVSFEGCNFKNPLRFDFHLPNYDLCIEVDGRQHYDPIEFFGGEESLELQQIKDSIKDKYCKDNKIRLLRIPYWDFDKIETILEGVLP